MEKGVSQAQPGDLLHEADDSTAALTLRLLETGLEELSARAKRQTSLIQYSNSEAAVILWLDEVHNKQSLLRDNRMAQSIARAVQTNRALLTRS
jgi:hypothetical protein